VLDLVILSLAFMIHVWALPYSFKNLLFDCIIRVVQIGFSLAILFSLSPATLTPTLPALLTGTSVGAACLAFQLVYNKGARAAGKRITRQVFLSQLMILLFFLPAEELFYRGMVFTRLASIWGPFTALLISTALSTMVIVVSTRKPLYWTGAALMGLLCGLGCYYTGSIWAPIVTHVLNDLGFETLQEPRNLFQ
jgi:membrane protease YdiL (CAAX protease family)